MPVLPTIFVPFVAGCFAALTLLAGAGAVGDTGRAGPDMTETRHYRIYSHLDPHTTALIADELEQCWVEYDRRLGRLFTRDGVSHDPPGGRYEVWLFRDEDEYRRDVGEVPANSVGVFDARRRRLSAFMGTHGRAELRRTLRHEAFHQFAYELIGPSLPLWVNEGLAQVFEHGIRGRHGLHLGEVPPLMLPGMRQALNEGRLFDFDRMLAMQAREWGRVMADPQEGTVLYHQAYLMVHMLAYAQGPDGQPLYRDRFNAFLTDVASGTAGPVAWRHNFGTNLDGFRQRFERYVHDLRPTPMMLEIDRHEVLAAMLADLCDRGVRFADVDGFREHVVSRRFRLQRTLHGVAHSTPDDPSPLFADARGRRLDATRLRFEIDVSGELPALVSRPGDGWTYTTRFHRHDGRVQYETTLAGG